MHAARNRYEIRIKGHLDPAWSDRLNGLAIRHFETDDGPVSLLTGALEDQSALSGVLNALIDIQVDVLSVDRIGSDTPDDRRVGR